MLGERKPWPVMMSMAIKFLLIKDLLIGRLRRAWQTAILDSGMFSV
jgi:hypothetical protein